MTSTKEASNEFEPVEEGPLSIERFGAVQNSRRNHTGFINDFSIILGMSPSSRKLFSFWYHL